MRFFFPPGVEIDRLSYVLSPLLGEGRLGCSDYFGGNFVRFPDSCIRGNRDPIAGGPYDDAMPGHPLLLEFDQPQLPDERLEQIAGKLRDAKVPFRFVDDKPAP